MAKNIIGAYFPPDNQEQLRHLAEVRNTTRSDVLRNLVHEAYRKVMFEQRQETGQG